MFDSSERHTDPLLLQQFRLVPCEKWSMNLCGQISQYSRSFWEEMDVMCLRPVMKRKPFNILILATKAVWRYEVISVSLGNVIFTSVMAALMQKRTFKSKTCCPFRWHSYIFQQDNAKPHFANIARKRKRKEEKGTGTGPACSPEASPKQNCGECWSKMRQQPRIVAHQYVFRKNR